MGAQLADLHLGYGAAAILIAIIVFARVRSARQYYSFKVESGWQLAILAALALGYLVDTSRSLPQSIGVAAGYLIGGVLGWRASSSREISVYVATQELDRQPRGLIDNIPLLLVCLAGPIAKTQLFGLDGGTLANAMLLCGVSFLGAGQLEGSLRALRTLEQPDDPATVGAAI